MNIDLSHLQNLTLNDCRDFPDGLKIPTQLFEIDTMAQKLVAKEIYLFEDGVRPFFSEEEIELFIEGHTVIIHDFNHAAEELAKQEFSWLKLETLQDEVGRKEWILFMTIYNKRSRHF